MAFELLKNLARNIIALDENLLLNEILLDKSFQAFILSLNTDEQLFKEGVNSLNVSLDSIGGGYSDATKFGTNSFEGKVSKGQPIDRVTLKDSEKFHESFEIVLNPKDFDIVSDPIKDGVNLFERWGKDVEGLTPEHLQIVIDAISGKLEKLIREKIAA